MIDTNGTTIAGLHPHHLAKLRSSGLSDDTIRENRLRSVDDRNQLAEMLNRPWPRKNGPALVFPYVSDGGDVILHRVRPDNPPIKNERPQKYLHPSGQPPRPYFPQGVREAIANADQPVCITEGELKALAATQAGFPCISIPGVDCWHRKKSSALVPDLQRVEWGNRTVYIVFDSDAATNVNVRENEALIAAALARHGARVVKVVRLPGGLNGEKMGLDDFLVAHGSSAFAAIIAKAEDPEAPTADQQKTHASELDPAPEAAAILEADKVDGQHTERFYRGEVLRYRDGRYCSVSRDEARARVVRSLNRGYSYVTPGTTSAVFEQIKAQSLLPEHIEPPAWLDRREGDWPASEVLAVSNGLLHLPAAAEGLECLRPPTPRFFTRNVLPFRFDANAPTPEGWLNFLESLWPDDAASVDTLQEWFGLALTPDTRLQKLLMLIGPKRSGKGTIARVLRAVVGESNTAGPTLASLSMNFGLAALIDKPLAIIADARLSGRTDPAVVLERILSVTGEDAQTIDRKHLPAITAKLPTRFMLLSNELPRLTDSSGAMASRIILLRLTRSFYGHEDHALTDKLLTTLPSILNWSIAGWKRLRDRGRLVQPTSALDMLADLEDLSSPIAAWIRECCALEAGFRASTAELYADWRSWCERKGRREPGTEQSFGRDLLAALPGLKRVQPRTPQGARYRAYEGIGLIGQLNGDGF